jgi:hypothetical protein
MPNTCSSPPALPSMRSTIHLSTRMFSPNPGQTNLPASSVRNQFTVPTFGSFAPWPCEILAAERNPMREVVAHVVAAKWQHRERVAPQYSLAPRPARLLFPNPSWPPCRRLRPSCALRSRAAPSSSAGRRPGKRRSRTPFGSSQSASIDGHCRAATVKAGVRMRGLAAGLAVFRSPVAALPVRSDAQAADSCLPTRHRRRQSVRRW